MKTVGFSLIVLALAFAAVPAGAQGGQTAFTLETHTEGGGGYFTLQGESARNPTLSVPASTEITVTLIGMDAGVHNIQVAGSDASEYVTAEGEEITYTFTSPASGTVDYWCVPHKAAGMAGKLSVASADGGNGATPTDGANGGGESNESPGLGLVGGLLALAGVALVLRRK